MCRVPAPFFYQKQAVLDSVSGPDWAPVCPSLGPVFELQSCFCAQMCPGAPSCAPDLLLRRGVLAWPFFPASRLFFTAQKKGLWGQFWFSFGVEIGPCEHWCRGKVVFSIVTFFANSNGRIRFRDMIRSRRCHRGTKLRSLGPLSRKTLYEKKRQK